MVVGGSACLTSVVGRAREKMIVAFLYGGAWLAGRWDVVVVAMDAASSWNALVDPFGHDSVSIRRKAFSNRM